MTMRTLVGRQLPLGKVKGKKEDSSLKTLNELLR